MTFASKQHFFVTLISYLICLSLDDRLISNYGNFTVPLMVFGFIVALFTIIYSLLDLGVGNIFDLKYLKPTIIYLFVFSIIEAGNAYIDALVNFNKYMYFRVILGEIIGAAILTVLWFSQFKKPKIFIKSIGKFSYYFVLIIGSIIIASILSIAKNHVSPSIYSSMLVSQWFFWFYVPVFLLGRYIIGKLIAQKH